MRLEEEMRGANTRDYLFDDDENYRNISSLHGTRCVTPRRLVRFWFDLAFALVKFLEHLEENECTLFLLYFTLHLPRSLWYRNLPVSTRIPLKKISP